MTANWRLKRRVRARVAKTGESYTAALRHVRRAEEAHMSTYELRHGRATDIGQVRRSNQDQLLVEGRFAAVADGMGEVGYGEIASELAVQTLKEAFDADPTAAGLLDGARAANRVVWERTEAEPDLRGIGTTIAAVALVADSGEDHSLVSDLVRAGQLSEDDARLHPERHILTQVLGVGPEVAPHTELSEAAPGDRVLLCSDGLFNELREDEITTILAAVSDPTEAAEVLVRLAKAHGGNDNITAVVLDIA